MAAIEKPAIIVNSNLSRIEGRGRERIFRVLAYDESRVCVVELGVIKTMKSSAVISKLFIPNSPSKNVRNRQIWPRSDVDASLCTGTLVRVAELGIPEQMAQGRFPSGSCPELDRRREAVEYIERYWGDSVFWSRENNARAVREAANRFYASENAVRKWFEMHKFYGGHENALMDHNWRKGAPGVSRRDLRDENGNHIQLGRRTDSEKLYGDKGHKRKRLTKQIHAEYSNFLKKESWDNCDPFPKVFQRWILSRVAFNRDREGEIVTYQIDPKNFPNDDYMKRIGRKLLKQFRAERDMELGAKPGKRGGSSQDIVHDQLSVLDMDGTVADNYLLFGDEHLQIDGRGKPTVLLAVDRASTAILGWDVSFGAENGDAYLNCVFSAYTPKTRELSRWGMPNLRGMVYGCASVLFIDRGPGVSLSAQTSLVERLRTATKFAPPGSPPSKGHAEQVMRYFQEELSYLSGSTFKTGDKDEDRKRQKNAKNEAVSLGKFMQALLKAISKRNLESDVRHLLTPDMIKKKVNACPAEIYLYNKSRRRGDAAWDLAPEDIFRKLCISRVQKAPNGVVTLGGRKYTSLELKIYSRNYELMQNQASVKIKTYELPNAPFVMLWEIPGQGLGLLDATESTKKMFEDGLGFIVEIQNRYRNHLLAEARFSARKQGNETISAEMAVSAVSVSKVKQAKIDSVENNAVTDVPMAQDFGSVKEQARWYLESQKVKSNTAGFIQAAASETAPSKPVSCDIGLLSIDDEQDLFIDDVDRPRRLGD